MPISGLTLLNDIGVSLQDDTGVIWGDDVKKTFVNEAILMIANLRPDSSSCVVDFPIISGSAKQTIPDDGFIFLEATRNIGGAARPIKQIDRGHLDNTVPSWSVPADGVSGIEIAMFDQRIPKSFYIYPVPLIGTSLTIELMYGKTPATFTGIESSLPIDDIWLTPIKEFVLYRAFGMNSKRMNIARAASHLNAFYNALNIKAQNDTILARLQEG